MLLNEVLGLSIRQSEVDFVIPNLKEDLQLYIDPFLFYKSRNQEFQALHSTIRKFFDIAIENVKGGHLDVAKRMINFPEVKETMLGLSSDSHKGRGLGHQRNEVIYNEIVSNPDILKNGIRHLAEMQLLIENVGFDMVSDMCTNIIKPYFVNYTQRQAQLHNIPLEKGLCLQHVFDWDELDWDDISADLPANPITGLPILLVPKTVVRRFAEIDYKDFWNQTYRYMLHDIEVKKSLQTIGREPKITWKEINEKYNFCKHTVVDVLHRDSEVKRQYLTYKEANAIEDPEPLDLNCIDGADNVLTPGHIFISELQNITPGRPDCKKYESLMLRILTRLFSPPLSDPHSQVTTIDEREIIDITFYNAANHGFWHDIKSKYGSQIVVFELKNMTDLSNEEYFQIASRLDDIRGKFGILIARSKDNLDLDRAYRRLRNERKCILTLSDADIILMIENLDKGLLASMQINSMYRQFIEEA